MASSKLRESDCQIRDRTQFELKSEFFINPLADINTYRQEVYFFIPNALQVDSQTYTKKNFYLDQTSFIRYKTPILELKAFVDLHQIASPLIRLDSLTNSSEPFLDVKSIPDELKLFGDMYKAALRDRVDVLLKAIHFLSRQDWAKHAAQILLLCSEVNQVLVFFRSIKNKMLALQAFQNLKINFKYVDEFVSKMTDQYFIQLLQQLREWDPKGFLEAEKPICNLLSKEKLYRKKSRFKPKRSHINVFTSESTLHREELLNNYMLEALALTSHRFSLEEIHGNILGAITAGIAMFVYMILLVWGSNTIVMNSFPFILFAVFFYILKDRIKEGLKRIFYQHAWRWFPDFSTQIFNAKGSKIGNLAENFTFLKPSQLPPGFIEIRKFQFHEELPDLERHETIIQYKREVTLFHQKINAESRRRELSTIFRFNLQRLLLKANDPLIPFYRFDPFSHEIQEIFLPKVYHLNLIIRNLSQGADLNAKSEIKLYRFVMDKQGIIRLDQLTPPS